MLFARATRFLIRIQSLWVDIYYEVLVVRLIVRVHCITTHLASVCIRTTTQRIELVYIDVDADVTLVRLMLFQVLLLRCLRLLALLIVVQLELILCRFTAPLLVKGR